MTMRINIFNMEIMIRYPYLPSSFQNGYPTPFVTVPSSQQDAFRHSTPVNYYPYYYYPSIPIIPSLTTTCFNSTFISIYLSSTVLSIFYIHLSISYSSCINTLPSKSLISRKSRYLPSNNQYTYCLFFL